MRFAKWTLLVALACPPGLFAQFLGEYEQRRGDTIMYAFNSDWEPITNFYVATYHRKAWKISNYLYQINDYFRNGSLQMKATGNQPNPFFDDEYTGELIRYYANGDTANVEYRDVAHKLDGDYIGFYENGQLRSKGRYRSSDQTGPWLYYHENGQLRMNGSYVKGKRDGEWVEFWDNGQQAMTGSYEAGDRMGTFKHWFENGQFEKQYTYNDSSRIADSVIAYHDNGAIARRSFYDDGKKQGRWTYYFQDGTLSTEMTYRLDTLEGPHTSYYESGQVHMKMTYQAGKIEGELLEYHPDGSLKRSGIYAAGEKRGKHLNYWPNGQVKHEVHYQNGEVRSEKWYDRNGKKMKAGEVVQDPRVKGGSISDALKQRLKVPEQMWVRDRVVVSYVVTKNGLADIDIRETANDSIDTLVVRALRGIEWETGTSYGEPCAYRNELLVELANGEVKAVRTGNYYRDGEDDEDEDEEKERKGFFIVEQMPSYKGGNPELFKFLGKETTYPAGAKDANASGVVYIQFVVEPSGLVSSPKVIRRVHPQLDLEALRVVKQMPDWYPGYQAGKPVRVFFNLPLRFTLR